MTGRRRSRVTIDCVEGSAPRRVGLMVIKVWRDPADGGPLRGRITESTDAREGNWSVSTCSSQEEIMQTIDRWLNSIP